jgi:hypothetical protein
MRCAERLTGYYTFPAGAPDLIGGGAPLSTTGGGIGGAFVFSKFSTGDTGGTGAGGAAAGGAGATGGAGAPDFIGTGPGGPMGVGTFLFLLRRVFFL